MLINFFTTDGMFNKISESVGFIPPGSKDPFHNFPLSFDGQGALSALIGIGLTTTLAIIVFVVVFVIKFIAVILSNKENVKERLIFAIKEFVKIFFIFLILLTLFQLGFYIFDIFLEAIDIGFNNYPNVSHQFDELIGDDSIGQIPKIIYYLVTNGSKLTKDNANFLFPSDYFERANEINFIVSILFVLVFAGFLVWIVWSVFQKMIEIFLLFVTFPLALPASLFSEKINWRIWTKEIFNKLLIVVCLLFFLRVFVYMFSIIFRRAILDNSNIIKVGGSIIGYGTTSNGVIDGVVGGITGGITGNTDNSSSGKAENLLYMAFFFVLALGGAMAFFIKFIAYRYKESIGIIETRKSFKQLSNFINNYKNETRINNDFNSSHFNTNINEMSQATKQQISNSIKNNRVDYNSLRKAKVFSK